MEKALWLMVSVRDRALIGKHDTVGRAYICLDPRRYGDFLTHDLWLDLDDGHGRILLRISMEGEKHDPQFYFGRAFRSLKRAESDMVRVFVDKVSHIPIFLFVGIDKSSDFSLHTTKRLETCLKDADSVGHTEHRLQQGHRWRPSVVPFGARHEQL